MSGSYHVRKRNRLEFLHNKKNGKCYYCGVKTSLPLKNSDHQDLCLNMATIEHLYPKSDIRRFLMRPLDNTVLSCYKCNQTMNDKTDACHKQPMYDREFSLIKLLENEQDTY